MQTKNCNKNIHKKKFKHHCMLIGLCSTLLSNILFDADWLTDWLTDWLKKNTVFSQIPSQLEISSQNSLIDPSANGHVPSDGN